MARTLNRAAHAVRRDTFVEAAQRLIQTRGYEQLSIQDVLEATGASKGAFYHYFDSKEALLQAVIERIVDAALAEVEPLIQSSGKTATEKLIGMFSGIAGWKNARKELMLALIEVWMGDDNIVVRERFRGSLTLRLAPLLTRIVSEGVAEGEFEVEDSANTAVFLVGLIVGANEAASRLFLDCQKGAATVVDVRKMITAFERALERVLAAKPGSLDYVDERTLEIWFGKEAQLQSQAL
jgi:AcrR family transcriptional regulator